MIKKNARLFIFVMLFAAVSLAFQSWEKPSQPLNPAELSSLLVHPLDASKMILASHHQIYEGLPNGPWQTLWEVQGTNREIHQLLHFKEIPDALFVLTSDGAFMGDFKNQKWREIYHGKTKQEKSVLAFAVLPEDPEHWFAGTEGGLFESDDAGKTWFRFDRFSKREPIPALLFAGNRLLLATDKSIYLSEDLTTFRSVFSLASSDSEEFLDTSKNEQTENDFDQAGPVSLDFHSLIGTAADRCETLYLGTEKGVFESRDCGSHWKSLSTSGLQNVQVQALAFSKISGQLFAGTATGIYVYRFQDKRWEEMVQGLAHPKTQSLSLMTSEPDKKEWLLAVTEDGFVRYPILPDGIMAESDWVYSAERMNLFRELVRLEPTARQTHQAVVHYNDLGNGKIKRWHKESRLRALVPTFSFGRNFSRTNNVDIDRGSTNSPDLFMMGPDDMHRGWDMDVRWDMADFIWSSNQTSIDSREKLMVELRNDFLAEVTRLYYERRRLQMETAFSPAASEEDHFERLMRLDELTSLLDGMTDGFLSKRLKEIYSNHPEFDQLWLYTKPHENGTKQHENITQGT